MQMRQHATCNKARLATMKAHMKYERANEALHERCHAKLLQHTHMYMWQSLGISVKR